ncbi:putative disease resistance RPP13 protein 1 [Spatholobus suberectus]|nr:putative disease resistance RPP13 protein 1 [Spatholobus suberectus]
MAAAFVGEAFLSASVEVLLERIVSHEFLHFFQSKEFDEWLDELTHALYDADDLLDEINTEALRCKVEAVPRSQPISDQVRNFLSYPFKRFYGVVNSEIQDVFQRLAQFSLQIYILGLREGVSSRVWHGTPASSVVDESAIYGRDDDRKILKDYLLPEEDNGSGSKIGVITIVGMGGLGKTTLAKLLYNDHEVKEKFDLKAWAYISKDFDVCKVTKSLLESVMSAQSQLSQIT